MLLALAVILLQAPAVPAPAISTPYTNTATVSVAAAPERKDDAKPDTKADTKDGEKKSPESKESGTNVSYQPGQTVVTPIIDSANHGDPISGAPGTFSSSLSAGAGQPIMPVTVTKRRRPEAARMGVPKMWFVLGAVEHGAATFDAWSTRRNIMEGSMHEANPLMRPFANSNAMYAAVQVAPVLFDLLSKRMMRNSHSWVRKSWWVPQTASAVTSILSGAHNVAIH